MYVRKVTTYNHRLAGVSKTTRTKNEKKRGGDGGGKGRLNQKPRDERGVDKRGRERILVDREGERERERGRERGRARPRVSLR